MPKLWNIDNKIFNEITEDQESEGEETNIINGTYVSTYCT